jgi:RNA polymerase sigma factor (sigma-70 family)
MMPSESTSPMASGDLEELLVVVRRALSSRYGMDVGADATSEAARWAVENGERLAAMTNPGGYLFRVGQTAAGRLLRWQRRTVTYPREPHVEDEPYLGGDVFDALKRLSADQRTAVLMVHGYGFHYREVAEVLGKSEAAVTSDVHRGMSKLRTLLEDPS